MPVIMISIDNWSKQQQVSFSCPSCLLPAVYKLSSTLSSRLFSQRKANHRAHGALSSILTAGHFLSQAIIAIIALQ